MVGCAYFFFEKHVFVEHPTEHPKLIIVEMSILAVHRHHHHHLISNDQVVCHGDTRVSPSKEGDDPYAEPKARGIFVKVTMMMENGDKLL